MSSRAKQVPPPLLAPKNDAAACGSEASKEAWAGMVAFLRGKGARVTQARRAVFDAVMSRHDHFRADELASELVRGPGRVSRGTIYRTLALLVEAGFVRAIRDSDMHHHYEHIYGHSHHEHLICEACGAFIEFRAPEIGNIIREQCGKHGFREVSHRISVLGMCRACLAKKERGG
ncbi:MAG TPA: Fur family transcriptional regulator [Sumerlaeia bacterium]|nr:Fur family transcriptional regulator [Sumerlaeia bacterium]